MLLNFKISFNLPAYGNNKLHADVLIARFLVWLGENIEKDEYYVASKYEDADGFIFPTQGHPGSGVFPLFQVGPFYKVKMLFLKEEDRNLFQLVWNTQLMEFGAKRVVTRYMMDI